MSFHLCSTALTEEKSKCSRCQTKMNILLYSLTRDKWETQRLPLDFLSIQRKYIMDYDDK